MSDRNIMLLLFMTVLVVSLLPLSAAMYFLDRSLQISLNLGFNPRISGVLKDGEIHKLGAERAVRVDVRIISATHKDLKQCISEGLKDCRDQAERDFIIATLKNRAGNISRAALDLRVRRPYLHRRMTALGISKKDYFG